jgi:hypothetical protein
MADSRGFGQQFFSRVGSRPQNNRNRAKIKSPDSDELGGTRVAHTTSEPIHISRLGHRGRRRDMKEKILAAMGAAAVIPQQYFDALRWNRHLEPESSSPGGCNPLFPKAEQWIMHTGNDWIFSFDNVCELMDLAPQYLRRGLLEWRQQTLNARKRQKGGGLRGQAA